MPEDDEQLLREQIRGAHTDRTRARRKLARKPEQSVGYRVSGAGLGKTELISGRVIRSEGVFFVIRLADGKEARARSYKGTRSANPKSTLVAVGDEVKIAEHEQGYLIDEVLARHTKLSRRAAGRKMAFEQVIISNIDLLVIVASVHEPKLRSGIIDRYIVAGVDGGLEIVIAINKADLATPDELDESLYFRDLYLEIGYPVYLLSAAEGKGIEQLKEEIAGKTSVFAGHSGVGKSSIVNAILGREAAQTGALQKKFRRGAHTTSASTLIETPRRTRDNDDGEVARAAEARPTFIADTPGVREFANFELDPGNLKFAFVEFHKFQERCAIPNCSHIHEPGCAVRQAVEDDAISIDRYTSYQKLLGEAQHAETKRIRNQ